MKKFLPFLALAGAATLPATAQTVTSINLHNTAHNNVGASLTAGTVFNYPNAAPGVDAYVKVMGVHKFNSAGGSQVNNVGVAFVDNPASVNGGFDAAFQPAISSSTNSSGLWLKGSCSNGNVTISHSPNQDYQVHFRLYFKKAGTNLDTALTLNGSFLDIDGFGSGTTEREQDAFMPGEYYALSTYTSLSVSPKTTPFGNFYNAVGSPANIANITATQNGTVQVRYRNRTYVDFALGMKTMTGSTAGSCYSTQAKGRLFSVSFASTCQPNYTPPCPVYTTVCISGKVWHDANNSANGTFNNINQTGEPGTDGSITGSINPPFYAYALDSMTGTVIGKDTIAPNGTYTIIDIPQRTPVRIVISTRNVAVGTTNGLPALFKEGSVPSAWAATTPAARPPFVTGTTNVTGLDFGINYRPTANNNSQPAQTNPNTYVTIPSTAFTGTDLTPGVVDTIVLVSYPANIQATNGLRVGTTNYSANSSVWANGGLKFTANSSGNPAQTVQVYPLSGSPTVQIPYKLVDNGNLSSNQATVNKPFNTPLAIELLRFDAVAEGNASRIQWATSSEDGTTGFEVEWSADAKDWKSIGTQAAAGRAAEYAMLHSTPATGANYYRLRTASADGSVQYSAVARVNHAAPEAKVSVGPNPVTSLLWFDGADGSIATLTDMSGKDVACQAVSAGSPMDIQRFSAGVYTVTLRDASGAVLLTQRIVKQ